MPIILPPLSLYIHYPWCISKCPYCDFNSHDTKINNKYIDVLIDDLKNSIKYTYNRKISSIFIGGGTPSLMSLKEIDKLFNAINKYLPLAANVEITIEANPSSAEAFKFKYFNDIGINRLSIGVQSFNDQYLRFLGRAHNKVQAINAVNIAKDAGFNNLNIDIMYGLKTQNILNVEQDLQQTMQLEPSHISFYQLNIENNTYFAKYPPKLPTDDSLYKMSITGSMMLIDNNYKQYEVSAYGKIAKHNINYWQFGDYIGIGAGAHGKITTEDSIIRTIKNKSPAQYIICNTEKIIAINNIAFEFMLGALRLKDGFDINLFASRTYKDINVIDSKLQKAQQLGLLKITKKITPTILGFNYLNDLQELFLQ